MPFFFEGKSERCSWYLTVEDSGIIDLRGSHDQLLELKMLTDKPTELRWALEAEMRLYRTYTSNYGKREWLAECRQRALEAIQRFALRHPELKWEIYGQG